MANSQSCPKCGSSNIAQISAQRKGYYENKCNECGYVLSIKKNNTTSFAENEMPSGKIILEG